MSSCTDITAIGFMSKGAAMVIGFDGDASSLPIFMIGDELHVAKRTKELLKMSPYILGSFLLGGQSLTIFFDQKKCPGVKYKQYSKSHSHFGLEYKDNVKTELREWFLSVGNEGDKWIPIFGAESPLQRLEPQSNKERKNGRLR